MCFSVLAFVKLDWRDGMEHARVSTSFFYRHVRLKYLHLCGKEFEMNGFENVQRKQLNPSMFAPTNLTPRSCSLNAFYAYPTA
jgi:hypothetical protein